MKTKMPTGRAGLTALLLIFSLFATLTVSAAAAAPSVSVDPVLTENLCPGDTFPVTVEVNSDTYKLKGVTLDLTYNPAVLQVNSVDFNDELFGAGNYFEVKAEDDGAGTIEVDTASKKDPQVPESGTLVDIVFEVKAGAAAATYPLTLQNVDLADENSDPIPSVGLTNGNAKVIDCGTTPDPTVKVAPVLTEDLCPGYTFPVTVEVNSDTYNLKGVTLELTYNPAVLQVNSVDFNDELFGAGNYHELKAEDDGAGTIEVDAGSKKDPQVPESGTLVDIVFEVKAGAAGATYPLTLQNVDLADENSDPIPSVGLTNGNAKVIDCSTTPTPTVKVAPVLTDNLCPGDTFPVTVEVNSDTYNLKGVTLDLTYNPAVLQVNSVDFNDELFGAGNYFEVKAEDDGAGTIEVDAGSKKDPQVPESGTLVDIVFEVKAGAADATYPLTLQNVDLADENSDPIPSVGLTNGNAKVVDCSNVDPTVTVTYPTSGTVSGTIDVIATATDTDGTVVQVAFYLMPGDTPIGTDANSAGGWIVSLDTTTVSDGDYQIKAVATDNESATGENTGSAFAIDNSCPCDFCLDLEEGWNFVSIPKRINGSNGAVGVFNLVQGETCLYYDGCAEGWLSNYQINVVPCQGYWVYKVADEKICVYFDPGTGQNVPPSQNLCEGWNMIGHIDTSLMPVDDGSITDFGSITTLEGKFAQMWQWTQEDGYEGYPLGGFVYLTPGQGYWILVEDATMYGTL